MLRNPVVSSVAVRAARTCSQTANVAAPEIARRYWNLPADATLRDVVEVVRADEAHHRDVNHGFANELAGLADPARVPAVWPHEPLEPHWRDAA